MHTEKENRIYKKHIQVYSDVQKIINEVHYVPSQHGQIEKNYPDLGSNELSV